MLKIQLATVAAAAFLALAPQSVATAAEAASSTSTSAQEHPMDRTVTVSASARVSATPDEAHVSTGVSSDGKTAREALTKNSEAMRKVIGELKKAGIDPKDIQTSQFNIEPIQVYKENEPPRVTGYRAHNMVSVMVRDLDKLGDVLDNLVSAGANQMNGISFSVSKDETLKDEARKLAMANALRRAKLYAEAAGASVGEIVQISEDVTFSPPPQPMLHRGMAMAEAAAPVERGSLDLEARVTATWRLK